MFLVQDSYASLIGAGGIDVLLHLPIQITELQQQHSFVRTILGSVLYAFLPCVDAMSGVIYVHVDVTHCVIDLIQIVFVLVALGHSLQLGYHLTEFAAGHNLSLGYTGTECHLVRRVGTHNFSV